MWCSAALPSTRDPLHVMGLPVASRSTWSKSSSAPRPACFAMVRRLSPTPSSAPLLSGVCRTPPPALRQLPGRESATTEDFDRDPPLHLRIRQILCVFRSRGPIKTSAWGNDRVNTNLTGPFSWRPVAHHDRAQMGFAHHGYLE